MPNWVDNRISIHGTKEEIAKIKAQLSQPIITGDNEKIEETEFSFLNIIAPPKDKLHIYYGEVSSSTLKSENEDETTYNWYNWNITNWGTKWDVSSELSDLDGTETSLSYAFQTAWSPPIPALQKLSEQHPSAEISLWWEEEQGFGGEEDFSAGCHVTSESWDIPSSHADHEKRDKECVCEYEDNPLEWYDDCPLGEGNIFCHCGDPACLT